MGIMPVEGNRGGVRKFRANLLCALANVVIQIGAGAASLANINLEVRAVDAGVRVGDTVAVGLYAVSDDGTSQPFAALDAILAWDASVLRLMGNVDDGPYEWWGSSFPDDSRLSRLNADCAATFFCSPYTGRPFNDGNALYEAIAPFGLDPPPYATAPGLLVTTFLFRAEAGSPGARIELLPEAGQSATVVVGAKCYEDVTGMLDTLTFPIAACGSMGDFDGDCVVSLPDHSMFVSCRTGPGAVATAECGTADLDVDGDADLRDFAGLQILFGGT